MHDTELRKTIGKRAKARRKELGLTLDYMAEKLDVNKSTIMRYEKGVIDNTKRLVIEGLATALHVTPEYLRGETDDYQSEVNDKRTLQIIDYMEKNTPIPENGNIYFPSIEDMEKLPIKKQEFV